jgi:NADH dehydrogenase (ubiquinone) 1 alpha subcomplex subunit 13
MTCADFVCVLPLGAFVCRELKRESAWARIHLVPLLLAEGDRDAYRRDQAARARESEIMKDVRGWEVRVKCSGSRVARSDVDVCGWVFG